MDYKNNNRYFHRSFKLLYIGAPMIAIGAVVVFGKIFRRYVHIENIFTALMAVGALIVLFFLVSFPRDKEYDRGIREKTGGIRAAAEAKITPLEHTPHFMENYVAEGFVYGDGTSELKRGSDGIFRTDLYTASQLIITLKKLYIYTVTFSMIKDETATEFISLEFDSIISASVEEELFELDYEGKHGAIRRAFFCIKTAEKEYRLPTHNDSLADNMASKIMLRNQK